MSSSTEIERLAYTPAELARAAGLSRKAIYRAIEQGELRAARVCGGSRLLIPAEAASEWLEYNVVEPREYPEPAPGELSRRNPGRVLGDAFGVFEEPPLTG
jgi:excisionase family DNA binding protein